MKSISLLATSIALAALGAASVCIAAESSPSVDAAAASRGKPIYEHWCMTCHGYGAFRPGTDAMRRSGFTPPYLTERSDITPALTEFAVRNGMKFMPWFRKTEISDAELADLAAYLATAHRTERPPKAPPPPATTDK